DGKDHTVQFGRVGTAGQTQTKEFATEAEAQKAYEKLVAEKLRKGYVEAGSEEVREQASNGVGDGSKGAGAQRRSGTEAKEAAEQPAAASSPPAQPEPAVSSTPLPLCSPAPLLLGPSAPSERSIDLEPQDWFWATWRPREPLPRPDPPPFDCQEALS